jgi:Transposase domain (DUF772)
VCSISWDDCLHAGEIAAGPELLDAAEMAGHLVPPGSVFAFLAEHRRELFSDEFIADLFESRTGRPSLSPDLVGSVLVLQALHDLSDGHAADALRFDIRWKVACGRSLTQMSFDPSTLVYWRKRIARSERPGRVFDAVAEVIAQTGVLRGRRKRVFDSTVLDDSVATQDTVTQIVAAIGRSRGWSPGPFRSSPPSANWTTRGRASRRSTGTTPQANDELVSDLVNDALAVLAELAGEGAPGRSEAEADALGLLALVAGQDVEPAGGSDGTDGR